MNHRRQSGGWLALSLVWAIASLCCTARAAQPEGPPCTPQWVSMFSGPNAVQGIGPLLVHDFGDGPALYAVAGFLQVNHQTVWRVARFDLTNGGWSLVGSGLDNEVSSMILFDDGMGAALYAAGMNIGIRKWTGTRWEQVAPAPDGTLADIAAINTDQGPNFFAACYFAESSVMRWTGTKWVPVWASQGPEQEGVRKLVVLDDGDGPGLYALGHFQAGGHANVHIAKWDGASSWIMMWKNLGGWDNFAMTVFGEDKQRAVLATGTFTAGTSLITRGVAKWNSDGMGGGTWSAFSPGLDGHCDDSSCWNHCNQQAPSGCFCDQLCCSFLDCCNDLAYFCPYCSFGWGSYDSCEIHALATFDDGVNGPQLYAAGQFGSIGGTAVANIARWDGQMWRTVAEGIGIVNLGDVQVRTLVAYQPTNGDPPILFAAGNFTNTVVGDKYLVAYVGCPTRPPCAAADINCDGSVNVADLLSVINAWGACPPPPAKCAADIAPPPDGDGQINVADLLMVINNWG